MLLLQQETSRTLSTKLHFSAYLHFSIISSFSGLPLVFGPTFIFLPNFIFHPIFIFSSWALIHRIGFYCREEEENVRFPMESGEKVVFGWCRASWNVWPGLHNVWQQLTTMLSWIEMTMEKSVVSNGEIREKMWWQRLS